MELRISFISLTKQISLKPLVLFAVSSARTARGEKLTPKHDKIYAFEKNYGYFALQGLLDELDVIRLSFSSCLVVMRRHRYKITGMQVTSPKPALRRWRQPLRRAALPAAA